MIKCCKSLYFGSISCMDESLPSTCHPRCKPRVPVLSKTGKEFHTEHFSTCFVDISEMIWLLPNHFTSAEAIASALVAWKISSVLWLVL